jgi:hypothetical protein
MSEPPSRPNKRLSRRRLPKDAIRVICQKGTLELGPNLALALLNLSEDGACVLLKEALKPREDVVLNLETVISLRPVKCPGQVAWCQPVGDGTYSVGIRFERRVPWLELLNLTRES